MVNQADLLQLDNVHRLAELVQLVKMVNQADFLQLNNVHRLAELVQLVKTVKLVKNKSKFPDQQNWFNWLEW